MPTTHVLLLDDLPPLTPDETEILHAALQGGRIRLGPVRRAVLRSSR